MSGPRLLLLTTPGCHLCDDARAVLARVAAEVGTEVEERDITVDAAEHRRWHDWVPVVFVDGRRHGFWRVDEERLRRELAN